MGLTTPVLQAAVPKVSVEQVVAASLTQGRGDGREGAKDKVEGNSGVDCEAGKGEFSARQLAGLSESLLDPHLSTTLSKPGYLQCPRFRRGHQY